MQPSSFQIHKLRVLIEYKELCAQLYQLCYQRFPELKELLSALFNEKKSHIKWIQSQEQGVDSGLITINPNAVKVEAMRFIMQAISQKMDEMKGNSLSALQALLYIKDTENSMLERNFLNIFENDAQDFKIKKMALASEDQRNLNMIDSTLSDLKRPC